MSRAGADPPRKTIDELSEMTADVTGQAPELRNRFLRQSVAKIGALVIAEIDEWEHGQTDALAATARLRKLVRQVHEAIAPAWNCFDVAGVVSAVAQRCTKPFNRSVQAVFEVDEGSRGPQSIPQLGPSHDLAAVFEQHLKDFERLSLEADANHSVLQFSRTQVKFEGAKADNA